jgi:MYXO-CTERM domain-containing protein
VGYDLVTGLGSVDAQNLLLAWTQLSPTQTTFSAMPTGSTEGSPVRLAATVASNAVSNQMGGSVLFYFETVDDAGLADLALTATAPLTPTSSGHQGGTASATAIAPPGVLGKAKVVAFYAGDGHYLASWSPAVDLAFSSTFAGVPLAITLQPNEQYTFATSGGSPPAQWAIVRDSTCDAKSHCAQVEALSATTGAFQAGPSDGTTVIAAVDADGAEVRMTITVAGTPVDGGTLPPAWDAGSSPDAGWQDASWGPAPSDAESPDAPAEASAAGGDASVAYDATTPTADAQAMREGAAGGPTGAPGDASPHADGAAQADAAVPRSVAGGSGGGCATAGREDAGAPGVALFGAIVALGSAMRRVRRYSAATSTRGASGSERLFARRASR